MPELLTGGPALENGNSACDTRNCNNGNMRWSESRFHLVLADRYEDEELYVQLPILWQSLLRIPFVENISGF